MIERRLIWAAIATVGGYSAAHWWLCDDSLASDWILFVTAIVVVWYTAETVQMRKLAVNFVRDDSNRQPRV